MSSTDLAVFALQTGRAYGQQVAESLGVGLAELEEREFEWGQHKIRPLESVRGRDIYVVQSLHGDATHTVNDKLCRLLFFLATLRDAGARRVTAVVPFLCYSRKDRQTKPRDPVTTRYVAMLFEAAGVDRVVTLEVHNPAAFQNAFRCRTEHLEPHRLFASFLAERFGDRELTVASPDLGGIKRANRYRSALERRLGRDVGRAFVEKARSADVVSGHAAVGDLKGRTVVLVDDMICSGTTLVRAAQACRRAGAGEVVAVAAHSAFGPQTLGVLADAAIDGAAVLDHIPMPPVTGTDEAATAAKLHLLDGAGFIAEAIRRLHQNESLSEWMEA